MFPSSVGSCKLPKRVDLRRTKLVKGGSTYGRGMGKGDYSVSSAGTTPQTQARLPSFCLDHVSMAAVYRRISLEVLVWGHESRGERGDADKLWSGRIIVRLCNVVPIIRRGGSKCVQPLTCCPNTKEFRDQCASLTPGISSFPLIVLIFYFFFLFGKKYFPKSNNPIKHGFILFPKRW